MTRKTPESTINFRPKKGHFKIVVTQEHKTSDSVSRKASDKERQRAETSFISGLETSTRTDDL